MSVRQEQGHRVFAALYDRFSARSERHLFGPLRQRLVGDLKGRVLEVGVGTGATLPYYPGEAQVIGTEPDPHMLKRARARLDELGRANLELRQASAEDLPFEDASFDHVVSMLVLCTVPDQPRALREARRVLKPDGSLRFIEHVRNDDSRVWGTLQDVITPVWRWCAAGCHPNRRTLAAIVDAGFTIEWVQDIGIGPGTHAVYGVARRQEVTP